MTLMLAGTALAHKVGLYGYAEGDKLKGEAYFAGGDPARNCTVVLLDSSGGEIDQAQTNDSGAFEMALPTAPTPLTLVVKAGEGHQGDFALTDEDLGRAKPAASAAPAEVPTPAAEAAAAAPAAPLDTAAMEAVVAKVVEAKLAPLRAQLSRMEADRPSQMSQVIGGLGWILGLIGVAAFFLSRKRSR